MSLVLWHAVNTQWVVVAALEGEEEPVAVFLAFHCLPCAMWAFPVELPRNSAASNAGTSAPLARSEPHSASQECVTGKAYSASGTHRAAEHFGPVGTGCVEVWVRDCDGFDASQMLHLLNEVWVQQAHAVPQHVALWGLDQVCLQYKKWEHRGLPRLYTSAAASARG